MTPAWAPTRLNFNTEKEINQMVETARIERNPKRDTPLPDLTAGKIESNGPGKEDTLFAVSQLKRMETEKVALTLKHKRIRTGLKLQGHVLKDIEHNIAEEKLQDGTSLATMKNRARIAQFMGLPIGSQVSFVDILSGKAPTQEEIYQKAYDEGYRRGVGDGFPDEQAYPPMTQEGEHHVRGFNAGKAVNNARFLELNKLVDDAEAERARKLAAKNGGAGDDEGSDGEGEDQPASTH